MAIRLQSVMRAVTQGLDQRIGRRVPASGLTIDWQPLVAPGRSWWGRRSNWASRAEVVDLSVSGASVAVLGAHRVPVGAMVRIGLDGASGIASVRRADDSLGRQAIYGIQFLRLDPELTRRIAAILTSHRTSLDERRALTN